MVGVDGGGDAPEAEDQTTQKGAANVLTNVLTNVIAQKFLRAHQQAEDATGYLSAFSHAWFIVGVTMVTTVSQLF